jgi:NTE family protein
MDDRHLTDELFDIQRLRQYFNAAVRVRQLVAASRRDRGFVSAVRRGLLPLPFDPRPAADARVFPPVAPLVTPQLHDRRIGLVATGGSGVLASVVGVARALEEADLRISTFSLCSGSALFGFPLAAGLSAAETAAFATRLHPPDYVQLSLGKLARAPFTLGRGFSGFLRGERIEAVYRALLGDRRLGDLEIPAYAVVWNGEHDRLDYLGPRTHPDVPVATAVRLAITLPLMLETAEFEGSQWFDGGVVDIFPVTPVLDIEPPCDLVIGVNGFYPPGFAGTSVTGWLDQRASILVLAGQTRTMQHAHIARMNLARLRREAEVLMLDPVPPTEVLGVGLYRHFLDTSRWADFMRAGRTAARDALADADATADARPGAGAVAAAGVGAVSGG